MFATLASMILASLVANESGVAVGKEHILLPEQKAVCKNETGCVVLTAEEFLQLISDVHRVGAEHGAQSCKKNFI